MFDFEFYYCFIICELLMSAEILSTRPALKIMLFPLYPTLSKREGSDGQ